MPPLRLPLERFYAYFAAAPWRRFLFTLITLVDKAHAYAMVAVIFAEALR